jgi:hypothetical protein
MAPEVIEHNPYREKADVFSFGIVLWELLTGRIPYSDMTPLQAAVGVVQKGLRPPIPPNCPPPLSDIMRLCWQRDPNVRPSFEQVCFRPRAWSCSACLAACPAHRVASALPSWGWGATGSTLVLFLILLRLSLTHVQLKVKMEELLEVYRQQEGAGGVRKVQQAGGGGGGGLLARLRSGGSSSSTPRK